VTPGIFRGRRDRDIITELSNFQPFRVITRNSTFPEKGQAVDGLRAGTPGMVGVLVLPISGYARQAH
jgi:TolB-like protein